MSIKELLEGKKVRDTILIENVEHYSKTFDINFIIKKDKDGQVSIYEPKTNRKLFLPNGRDGKGYKNIADAKREIDNNFGFSKEQIEYNKTEGTLSPTSINYWLSKDSKGVGEEVEEEANDWSKVTNKDGN